jgi:hypothetical protein
LILLPAALAVSSASLAALRNLIPLPLPAALPLLPLLTAASTLAILPDPLPLPTLSLSWLTTLTLSLLSALPPLQTLLPLALLLTLRLLLTLPLLLPLSCLPRTALARLPVLPLLSTPHIRSSAPQGQTL